MQTTSHEPATSRQVKTNMEVAETRTQAQGPCRGTHYPIFAILAFFGFPMRRPKPTDRGHDYLRVLLVIYRTFWAVMQLALTLTAFIHLMASWECNSNDTGHYVVMTTNTAVAFLSYLSLWKHEMRIILLLDRVQEHWNTFLTTAQRKASQKQMTVAGVSLVAIYGVTLLSTFATACYVSVSAAPATATAKPTLAAVNGSKTFSGIKEALFDGLDLIKDLPATTVHLIICEAFYLFVGVLLVHSSLAVNACFQLQEYKADLLPDQSTQVKAMLTFKACHSQASELVVKCDKCVAWLHLLSVVNTLMACCAVYTIKYKVAIHHVLLAILIIEHLVSFFATFTASSEVNSQITASTYTGIPGFEESIAHSHFSDELATIIKMFVLYVGKMAIEIRGITVWGLFNVERGVMLTVAAAMLTYSVIVYDIGK